MAEEVSLKFEIVDSCPAEKLLRLSKAVALLVNRLEAEFDYLDFSEVRREIETLAEEIQRDMTVSPSKHE